jgi:hypothetical protein
VAFQLAALIAVPVSVAFNVTFCAAYVDVVVAPADALTLNPGGAQGYV